MAQYKSTKIANQYPAITGDEYGDVITERVSVAVDTSLGLNDVLAFCKLPAGHEPVDLTAIADQIDSNGTPTLTVSFGVLNDAGTDLVSGTNFITTSSTLGRASGGSINRATVPDGLLLTALNAVDTAADKGTVETHSTATSLLGRRNGDRVIGAKITAAAATKVAGTVTVIFSYRAV